MREGCTQPVYKLCKTEQSAVRQRQLEAGLLTVMESTRYEDISISDLCDRLEIPRKSFYRYFSSKDGALHALIDHTLMGFEPYAVEYQKTHARSVQRDLESFFEFWVLHRKLLDALARSGMSGILIERAISYALSDDVMPTRFLPGDTKMMQQKITTFAVCGLMSMVLTWHHDNYVQPAREMAVIAARLLSQPLFPEADRLM